MASPPFNERGCASPPATPDKADATIEGDADLGAWVRFSLAMARSKGTVTFIHRADRIDALLGQIAGRAGEVVIYPLWPGQVGRQAASWCALANTSQHRHGSPPVSCCTKPTDGSLPRRRRFCAREGGSSSDLRWRSGP